MINSLNSEKGYPKSRQAGKEPNGVNCEIILDIFYKLSGKTVLIIISSKSLPPAKCVLPTEFTNYTISYTPAFQYFRILPFSKCA